MRPIDLSQYRQPLFFTGAGMSAESGVPTYRGHGGIWAQYRFEEYACEDAFRRDPARVLDFHELRRRSILDCAPHAGHLHLAAMQRNFRKLRVVTQNIDGLLQRAGVEVAAELHGSLWRLRCERHGVREDLGQASFAHKHCEHCGNWLRPDVTWFHDLVDQTVFAQAEALVRSADLFVSIGTSGVVWPAAGFAQLARDSGAHMIEVNPEDNEASGLYHERVREAAGTALPLLFPLPGGR